MPRVTTSANCTGTLSAAQKTPETARPRSETQPEREKTRAPSARDAWPGSGHAAHHALFRDSLRGPRLSGGRGGCHNRRKAADLRAEGWVWHGVARRRPTAEG